MSVISLPFKVEKWIDLVSCVSSFIIMCILLIHHILKFKQFKRDQHILLRNNFSILLSFLMFFGALLSIIALIIKSIISNYIDINILKDNTQIICDVVGFCSAIGYGIFKHALYLALLYRLSDTFKDSMYSISLTCLRVLKIIIIIGFGAFVTFWTIDYYQNYIKTSALSNGCYHPVSIRFITYNSIFDFIICTIILYIFTTTLYKLSIHLIDADSPDARGIIFLMKKQLLLGIIAIIATLIAGIGVIILRLLLFWLSFDILISTFCITLMFAWNNKLVNRCCGKCLIKSVKKTSKKLEIKISTKIEISNQSNSTQNYGSKSAQNSPSSHINLKVIDDIPSSQEINISYKNDEPTTTNTCQNIKE